MVKKVPLVRRLYNLGRELDKNEICGTDAVKQGTGIVREYRTNPIVSEGISGNPTYPEEFISELNEKWSSKVLTELTYGGISRFFPPLLPRRKNKQYNEQVAIAEQIFPYASSFRTNGVLSFDNPVSGSVAGTALFVIPVIARYTIIPLVQLISGYSDQEIQQFYDNVKFVSEIYGHALGFTVGSIYSIVRHIRRWNTRRQAKALSETFSELFKNTR